jgi:rhodanese-related sulfurtransferase
MTWISILPLISLLAVVLAVKRSGRISRKAAAEYLRNGAVVIDVRSAGEFTAGHLPMAVNIPLSEIDTVIARKVNGKDQVLLLHCQSGGRSGAAQRRLKALGYEHAYNLGSYARAAQIIGSRLD